MINMTNWKEKAISKLKDRKAWTVIDTLFTFLLIMLLLLVLVKVAEVILIVKNTRDSLERATLNVAAVNEYKLYENFRENIIDDAALSGFVSDQEIKQVLSEEFGMEQRSDGMYKSENGNDYYMLKNITAVPSVDGNVYVIDTTATLVIFVGVFGYGEMSFDIDVSCIYASKSNAEK